jgi:hypothetical protein
VEDAEARRERVRAAGNRSHVRVGAGPARVRNVHRPAVDFEPDIRKLCRTANERHLGDLSGLRSLLYVAMLVNEYPQALAGGGPAAERGGAAARSHRAPTPAEDGLGA